MKMQSIGSSVKIRVLSTPESPRPSSLHTKDTMASYIEKKDQLTAEIAKLNKKARELVEMRELLLVEEARRDTMPSAATQIAQALINAYTEYDVSLELLFGVQSPEVNTAGLLQMAIQGHDGYWREDSPHWNEAVFDVLSEYKSTVKR